MDIGNGVVVLQSARKALKKLEFIASQCHDSRCNSPSSSKLTSSARRCLNDDWKALLRENETLIEELCRLPSYSLGDLEVGDGRISSMFWPCSNLDRTTARSYSDTLTAEEINSRFSLVFDLDEELCFKYFNHLQNSVAGLIKPEQLFITDTLSFLNTILSLLLFERRYSTLLDSTLFNFASIIHKYDSSHLAREYCIGNLLVAIERSCNLPKELSLVCDFEAFNQICNYSRLSAQILLVVSGQERTIESPAHFLGSNDNALHLVGIIETLSLFLCNCPAIYRMSSDVSNGTQDIDQSSNIDDALESNPKETVPPFVALLVVCLLCFMNTPLSTTISLLTSTTPSTSSSTALTELSTSTSSASKTHSHASNSASSYLSRQASRDLTSSMTFFRTVYHHLIKMAENYDSSDDICGALGLLFLTIAVNSQEYSERCLKQPSLDTFIYKVKKDASTMRAYSFFRIIVLRMVSSSLLLVEDDSIDGGGIFSTQNNLFLNEVIYTTINTIILKSIRCITAKCRGNISIFHDSKGKFLCDTLYDFLSLIRDSFITLASIPLPSLSQSSLSVNPILTDSPEGCNELFHMLRWYCEQASPSDINHSDDVDSIRMGTLKLLAVLSDVSSTGNCRDSVINFLSHSRCFWLNDKDLFTPFIASSRFIRAATTQQEFAISDAEHFESLEDVNFTDPRLELINSLLSSRDLYVSLSKELEVGLEVVFISFINVKMAVSSKGLIYKVLATICKHSPAICKRVFSLIESKNVIISNATSARHTIYEHGLVVGLGLKYELDELESKLKKYNITNSFVDLLAVILSNQSSYDSYNGIGSDTRAPGITPYITFVIQDALLKCDKRSYSPDSDSDLHVGIGHKYRLISSCLNVLRIVLINYKIERLAYSDDPAFDCLIDNELESYLMDFSNDKTEDVLINGQKYRMKRQKSPAFNLMAMLLTGDLTPVIISLLDSYTKLVKDYTSNRFTEIALDCSTLHKHNMGLKSLSSIYDSYLNCSLFSIDTCVSGEIAHCLLETVVHCLGILHLASKKEEAFANLVSISFQENGVAVAYNRLDQGPTRSFDIPISINPLYGQLSTHISLLSCFSVIKLLSIESTPSLPEMSCNLIQYIINGNNASDLPHDSLYEINVASDVYGGFTNLGIAMSDINFNVECSISASVPKISFLLFDEQLEEDGSNVVSMLNIPKRNLNIAEIIASCILATISKEDFSYSHALLGLENVVLGRPPFKFPDDSGGIPQIECVFTSLIHILNPRSYDNPDKYYILYLNPRSTSILLELLFRLIESSLTSDCVLSYLAINHSNFLSDVLKVLLKPSILIKSNSNSNRNSNSNSSSISNNNNSESDSDGLLIGTLSSEFLLYWRHSLAYFMDICAVIQYRVKSTDKVPIVGLDLSFISPILFNEGGDFPSFIAKELLVGICCSPVVVPALPMSQLSTDGSKLNKSTTDPTIYDDLNGYSSIPIILGKVKSNWYSEDDNSILRRISPFKIYVPNDNIESGNYSNPSNGSVDSLNELDYKRKVNEFVKLNNQSQLLSNASLHASKAYCRFMSILLDFRYDNNNHSPLTDIDFLMENYILPLSAHLATCKSSPFVLEPLSKVLVRLITILVNDIAAKGLSKLSNSQDSSDIGPSTGPLFKLQELMRNIIKACNEINKEGFVMSDVMSRHQANPHYYSQLYICLSKLLQLPFKEAWSLQSDLEVDLNTYIHKEIKADNVKPNSFIEWPVSDSSKTPSKSLLEKYRKKESGSEKRSHSDVSSSFDDTSGINKPGNDSPSLKVSATNGGDSTKASEAAISSNDMFSGLPENDRVALMNVFLDALHEPYLADERTSNVELTIRLLSSDIITNTSISDVVIVALSTINDILFNIGPALPINISGTCVVDTVVSSVTDIRYLRGETVRQKNIEKKIQQSVFDNCIYQLVADDVLQYSISIIQKVPEFIDNISIWTCNIADFNEFLSCSCRGHDLLFSNTMTLFSHVIMAPEGFNKLTDLGAFHALLALPYFISAPPSTVSNRGPTTYQDEDAIIRSDHISHITQLYFIPAVQFLIALGSTTVNQASAIGAICIQFLKQNIKTVDYYISMDVAKTSMFNFMTLEKLTRLIKWSCFHTAHMPRDDAVYLSSMPISELVIYLKEKHRSMNLSYKRSSQSLLITDDVNNSGPLAKSIKPHINDMLEMTFLPICFGLISQLHIHPISIAIRKELFHPSNNASNEDSEPDIKSSWWSDMKPIQMSLDSFINSGVSSDYLRDKAVIGPSNITFFDLEKAQCCAKIISHASFFLKSWFSSILINPKKKSSYPSSSSSLHTFGSINERDFHTLLLAFNSVSDIAALSFNEENVKLLPGKVKPKSSLKTSNFKNILSRSYLQVCENIITVLQKVVENMTIAERQVALGIIEYKEFDLARSIGKFPLNSAIHMSYLTLMSLFYVSA